MDAKPEGAGMVRRVYAQGEAGRGVGEMDRKLSTGKAAKALGVCVKTVRRYIQDGDLPAEKLPKGHYRIRAEDVEALLSEDQKVLELARRAGI